jgi:hypothetical protein
MNSHTGMGSSPILPIPSKRKLLRKSLQKLDRKISKEEKIYSMFQYFKESETKILDRIYKLDQQRKVVRNKLKGYK